MFVYLCIGIKAKEVLHTR